MNRPAEPVAPKDSARMLTDRTDFFAAWQRVNAADDYSPAVRARAFSLWVALFGHITDDGVVTRNAAEIADEFGVSRMSWLQYREVLETAGLIEQEREASGGQRRMVVRVLPPLRSD